VVCANGESNPQTATHTMDTLSFFQLNRFMRPTLLPKVTLLQASTTMKAHFKKTLYEIRQRN
jgi:hypothetical protein